MDFLCLKVTNKRKRSKDGRKEVSVIEYSKRKKKKLGKSVSSATRENLTKIR